MQHAMPFILNICQTVMSDWSLVNIGAIGIDPLDIALEEEAAKKQLPELAEWTTNDML